MNNIKNIWNKIFNIREKGVSCWVIADKGERMDMLEGTYYPNIKNSLLIKYNWIDGTLHEFIGLDTSWWFEFEKRLVFYHGVGDIFANRKKTDDEMTSDLFAKINDILIGEQLADKLEEFNEGGKIPWKLILIFGAIIIGAFILWKTGVIPSLINSIQGSIPGVSGQTPITPDIILPVK